MTKTQNAQRNAIRAAVVLLLVGGLSVGATAVFVIVTGVPSAQAGGDVASDPEPTTHSEPEAPTIPTEDAYAERVKNFPALQPYDTAEPLVPVSTLLTSARGLSTYPTPDAPVFAASLAYGDLQKFSPGLGGDTQIAGDRPMWVLTVHSPVENYGALAGSPAKVWDVYTVVFDGPTGDGIAFGTGEDIEKLGIPGEYVK
ncbi:MULTISPECIES: hypothetical protein [unclassified Rathayibacter]|uniref:hypothetical protein n=1 Tax=unclassified Rathayibacter TaxID=2609250 RepID=UPI0006F89E98|nr:MULTISPECIES: hypothetical protein [unclassified Rathayibacter]KQQ05369.1 hypothetical protein ASF42_01865 [Rathayibacter sp. Leaf294]KQS13233.1 hypothetical protein ASG06_01875 [Rathayibacter sp. Leaf185]